MISKSPVPPLSKLRRDWVIINLFMPKHNVTFLPNERRMSVDEEENLLQAAMEAGIHISASCGGSATCAEDKVKIQRGVVDSSKRPKRRKWKYNQGYRLARLTLIQRQIGVEISPESRVDKPVPQLKDDRAIHQYLLSHQDIYQDIKGWDADPAVFQRYAQLEPPTLNDKASDLTRLINVLDRQHGIETISADFYVNMKLSCLLRESERRPLLSPN